MAFRRTITGFLLALSACIVSALCYTPSGTPRRDFVLGGTGALITAATAATAPVRTAAAAAAPDKDAGYDMQLERVFDTKRGSYLPATPERFLTAANLPQITVIGEHHTHVLDHNLQFRTISALHTAAHDEPLAIGLEMFYRQHQPALDRFMVHGDIATLARETEWHKTWGYDLNSGYSKIFRYAHMHQLPLVGLNVPRAVVSLVRLVGLDGLQPTVRAALPELDLSVESHKNRFLQSMKSMEAFHGPMAPDVLQRFYEANLLWEEAMAASAASYVNKHGGRMAVMAGVAHVRDRDGIPDRLMRRLPSATAAAPFTVVPEGVEWDADGLPLVDKPPGPETGDWIWYTQMELPRVSKRNVSRNIKLTGYAA